MPQSATTAGTRLRAERVVTPSGVVDDALVEVDGVVLSAVRPYDPAADADADHVVGWVVPGFVDTHVHGGGGLDYASEDPSQAAGARTFHVAHGTTTSFASLVTASIDALCGQLHLLSGRVETGELAGIHLEGPFLSRRQQGAHEPSLLRDPDPESIERLLEAGRGTIALVTMAPELPGALDAIRRFVAAGVSVAVGHTDADRDTVAAALDAGARSATHLFNAMRGVHHREPGPVPVLSTDPRVGVEVIADGFHLHPDILRLVATTAGDRTMLVTDAMVAAGMPDGAYALGGLDVRVSDGMARLVQSDGTAGSIAGSTLTMGRAFAVMTEVLGGDIATVSALAASNAARHYGLDAGRIEVGARADLCIVDDTGGLQRVMRAGTWVDPA